MGTCKTWLGYPLFCTAMVFLGLYGLVVGRDEFNRQMNEVFPSL